MTEGSGGEATTVPSDDIAASTQRLAEWTFSLQGVGADLKRLFAEVKSWVRTQMAHWTDETPPPDPERDRRSLEGIVDAAVRAATRRATVDIRSDHNPGGNGRGNNGDKSWKQIAISILVGTILGGGASVIAMYSRVGSLETKIDGKAQALEQMMAENNRSTQQRMDDFIRANQQRHEETERRVGRLEGKVFP